MAWVMSHKGRVLSDCESFHVVETYLYGFRPRKQYGECAELLGRYQTGEEAKADLDHIATWLHEGGQGVFRL